ncbi:hypothetical protein Clacol_010540 [Clathrus columnatus]|uniref:Uncharacterized protein n=1 Tax=Clathrus columnatus TaxID=1419009 RepID=A0AAV5A307_9AGAM|nr:hypothetical protein Clacol_002209 [Clathrus columnatus]GJJ16244.1 hypothetical protein Clacol_010540 [Clathrus columnatus]
MTVHEAVSDNENDDQRTPVVELDVDEISHQMAARLTNTLLGHWLYMKGQVPFPVNSLERMSSQRYSGDLPFLDAYDDLNSHLRTTFVALSTAYAHNSTHVPSSSSTSPLKDDETQQQDIIIRPKYRSAKVCLFLVMGSSFSLPKARVLLELNNFHVEKFGEWEFISRRVLPMPSPSDTNDGDDESSSSTEDEDESHPEVGEEAKRNADDDDGDNNSDTDSDTEEIDSRQFFSVPSTPCQTASFYTAAGSDDDPGSGSDESPDTPSSSSGASECSETQEQFQTSPETSLSEDDIKSDNPQLRFSLSNEDAVEDESLRNGERKLSKALLKFGEVLGFDDEIAPTRTYILLRAPRRFSHPTWIPRQNLTSTLDKAMGSVLNVENNTQKKNRINKSGAFGSGVPTVGFRIVCQTTTKEEHSDDDGENNDDKDIDNDENDPEEDDGVEELDELIWWSWDGRLVGFSD